MSILNIKKRNIQGSSSSRRMRSEGILPGIMYGSDNEPNLVEMNLHQVEQILKNHNSDTILIEVDVENEGSTRVLMKEVQYHPVTSSILHVDLQKVVAGKPIQVGHKLIFGSSVSTTAHLQNIFVFVFNSICVSIPIVGFKDITTIL